MIDHLSVAVSDLTRAVAFYDAVFAPLGVRRLWTTRDAAGYGDAGTDEPFAIKQCSPEKSTAASAAVHVAFRAASRDAVNDFHVRAIAHGGTDDGAPGLHAEYGAGYFAAFVLDPDGNRLEAVLHE
jgi:catechol 2,3-dioxygenase-like lactoylglutathione lyase family enzyme